MTDLRDSLEGRARRYEPPGDWLDRVDRRRGRRRKNQRIAAGIVAAAVAFSVGLPLAWQLRSAPEQVPVIQPPSSPVGPLLWRPVYQENFDHRSIDSVVWPETDTPRYKTRYANDRFAVKVLVPFEHRYWVRAGSVDYETVRVRATIWTPALPLTTGDAFTSGFVGVMCVTQTEPADAYVFGVDTADDTWMIQRIDDGGLPRTLDRGELTGLEPGDTFQVFARCDASGDDGVLLVMRIFEHVIQVEDPDGFQTFSGLGMFAASRGDLVETHFDTLMLEVPKN